MKISSVGLELIKSFEGCQLSCYHLGDGVCTIGWGHTRPLYACAGEGSWSITQAQADQLLTDDIVSYAEGVEQFFTRKFTQNQFDALVSFTYNCGTGIFVNDGWEKNASDDYICESIANYISAGSPFEEGLKRRRKAEIALFRKEEVMSKIYDLAVAKIGTVVDFDGMYGGQCADLSTYCVWYACGVRITGNAIDTASPDNLNALRSKGVDFEYIANTPEFVPEKGDIMIEDPENGGWGHVSIVESGTLNQVTVIEQNYNGTAESASPTGVERRTRAYLGSPVGFLRIKQGKSPAGGAPSGNSQGSTAISDFKAAGNKFVAYGTFKADEIKQVNGIWQVVNYGLAGGRDVDWNNNGIPLDILDNKTRGNQQATQVGDSLAFSAGYNTGTIDEYDVKSNGVGISYGNYGKIWFNADQFIKL